VNLGKSNSVDWAAERARMVEHQIRARGIHDARVLAAMAQVPREEFVPEPQRGDSYADEPLSIGCDQTISQPYIVALMAECLGLKGHETVLEVGCGSGYHAAVLGMLAGSVVAVEILPELAALAEANLARTGRASNVRVVVADGSAGYLPSAPYDAISVAAAAPSTPEPLLEQLKDPGRLVIPVGDRFEQDLLLVRKSAGQMSTRTLSGVRFVPLRGGHGWR
jgi:protein-L-isoaspartate(D-aspartate) O-methyltransferase